MKGNYIFLFTPVFVGEFYQSHCKPPWQKAIEHYTPLWEHIYELIQQKQKRQGIVFPMTNLPPLHHPPQKKHPKETLGLTASMVSSLEFVGEIEESRGQGDAWMAIRKSKRNEWTGQKRHNHYTGQIIATSRTDQRAPKR